MIQIELLAFALPIAIAMIAVILEAILRTGWHGIIILSTLIALCFISALAAVMLLGGFCYENQTS